MNIILVRHGQTDWNVEGRWQGQADPSLNANGRAQATAVAQELRTVPFTALYSSDLRRAWQTAESIARVKGLPIHAEPRLREINLGRWQGMLSVEIGARFPAEFRLWHQSPFLVRPPDGEELIALVTRVLAAAEALRARHVAETICAVSHELPIAILRCHAAQIPPEELRQFIPENGRRYSVEL